MAVHSERARDILARILRPEGAEGAVKTLRPRPPEEVPLPPRIHGMHDRSLEALQQRRTFLRQRGACLDALSGLQPDPTPEELAGNIEHLIGFARVPVGVIGPLRINGTSAHGDFYIPLATTEGALVASYARGARLVNEGGGVTVACLNESVTRAPHFSFDSLPEAGLFVRWVLDHQRELGDLVASQSRHCRLIDIRPAVMGRELDLLFEFATGDASGQNMVTFATDAACRRALEEAPVRPRRWYIEGNMSGDKKATILAFLGARGRKVVAEASIPREVVRSGVHAEPQDLVACWQASMLGSIQAGAVGVQGHYANAVAALFIACGQDAACVSEASMGLTFMEVTPEGGLYVSVMMPNMIVGTVGGGTWLPTARECLALLGCAGPGGARRFAEICGAVALAGEVSICGAMAAGDFAAAHRALGRRPRDG